jgi:hypothetical protein
VVSRFETGDFGLLTIRGTPMLIERETSRE